MRGPAATRARSTYSPTWLDLNTALYYFEHTRVVNGKTLAGEGRGGEGFSDNYVTTNQIQAIFHPDLRTQPTFPEATTGLLAKWRLGNECGNSILTKGHYPDLVGESDWLKHVSHEAQPIESTTQIWVYDTSSVWNFCSHSTEVISRGNQWRRRQISIRQFL